MEHESAAAQEAAGISGEHGTEAAPVPAPAAPARGVLVTLEGVDGCGKSTQAGLLASALEHTGYRVLRLREPGGTVLSEKVRGLLLDPANGEMGAMTELLLYEAARAQLVSQVIAPALERGTVVVCDRFFDSTTAYQAYAGGLALEDVRAANLLATGGLAPDLTLVYDIDPAAAYERATRGGADRMEEKGLAFQRQVAEGFRAVAAAEPGRVKLVDASGEVPAVLMRTVEAVERFGLAVDLDAVSLAYEELV